MVTRRSKFSETSPILLVLVGLAALGLLVSWLLKGHTVELLSPKGLIATEQRKLLIGSVLLLLVIAVPTLVTFYFMAWKYRESNTKATHDPHPNHGKSLVFGIWALPTVTAIFLAIFMWPATHRLAPQKALESTAKPLTIQVVAMRWKWLFIYPEQRIATTNFIQIPTGTPVQFDITADEAPMSSFWIPQLAGQLYAMTGHVNRLNIMAETPGDYAGSSAELNGAGFAGMKFTARASSMEDFNSWVSDVKTSSDRLDTVAYKKLLIPTENNPAALYSLSGSDIYDDLLTKYSGTHGQHADSQEQHTEHE